MHPNKPKSLKLLLFSIKKKLMHYMNLRYLSQIIKNNYKYGKKIRLLHSLLKHFLI